MVVSPSDNTRVHFNCNRNRCRKSLTFSNRTLDKAYVTSVATGSISRGAERREGATPSWSGSRCGCRHPVSEAPFCLPATPGLKGRMVKIPLSVLVAQSETGAGARRKKERKKQPEKFKKELCKNFTMIIIDIQLWSCHDGAMMCCSGA